jgi:hypothetical protein
MKRLRSPRICLEGLSRAGDHCGTGRVCSRLTSGRCSWRATGGKLELAELVLREDEVEVHVGRKLASPRDGLSRT